jgi:hypothetical protein
VYIKVKVFLQLTEKQGDLGPVYFLSNVGEQVWEHGGKYGPTGGRVNEKGSDGHGVPCP